MGEFMNQQKTQKRDQDMYCGMKKGSILTGNKRCKRAIVEVDARNVGQKSNQAIYKPTSI